MRPVFFPIENPQLVDVRDFTRRLSQSSFREVLFRIRRIARLGRDACATFQHSSQTHTARFYYLTGREQLIMVNWSRH